MKSLSARRAIWALFFILSMALVWFGLFTPLNLVVGRDLHFLGTKVPATNLIWVVGGLLLTGLVVLVMSVRRRRQGWRMLTAFIGGLFIEVLAKHFITTPFPKATLEPHFYRALEKATNVTPSMAFAWLNGVLGIAHAHVSHHYFLRGSFPSGHVFRTTYASGVLLGQTRRQWTWIVALAAGFLVVATGGHWVSDVAGGFILAQLALNVGVSG